MVLRGSRICVVLCFLGPMAVSSAAPAPHPAQPHPTQLQPQPQIFSRRPVPRLLAQVQQVRTAPTAKLAVSPAGPDDPTDPYIVAQATALGNDPNQIFAFVRDRIAFEAYVGSVRGARGTLWSLAGNTLDKASLLSALLQASGFTVTSIRDVTPIPHNGCRPRKRRRV